MPNESRERAGNTLAVIGVLVLLMDVELHWWRPKVYAIETMPIAIGAILGFVGFYMKSPKEAEDGGNFLVTATVRLVRVFRTGRADDPPGTTVEESTKVTTEKES